MKSRLFHRPRRLYLRSAKTKSFPPCEGRIEFCSDDVARAIINESLSFRSGSRPGPSSRNKTINDFYLYSFVWLVSWGGREGGAPGPQSKSPVNYVRSLLIFVKPNSRGANKSSFAAASRERALFLLFVSPLTFRSRDVAFSLFSSFITLTFVKLIRRRLRANHCQPLANTYHKIFAFLYRITNIFIIRY